MAENSVIHPALNNHETSKSDSATGSPSSSSGAARPRQKQVPIARSSGSGYERPERARTSHACEPCRERKTKCDGERPACRRCLHTSTTCHYGYGKGWKKRKTAEDLNVTLWKLAKYEELLNEITPLVSQDVRGMIDDIRAQDYSQPHQYEMTMTSQLTIQGPSGEFGGANVDLERMAMPQPVHNTHHAAVFANPRSLPTPLPVSPSIQQPSAAHHMRRSPTEDIAGSPIVRLPSITRHGVILESGLPAVPGLSHTESAPELEHQQPLQPVDGFDSHTPHSAPHG